MAREPRVLAKWTWTPIAIVCLLVPSVVAANEVTFDGVVGSTWGPPSPPGTVILAEDGIEMSIQENFVMGNAGFGQAQVVDSSSVDFGSGGVLALEDMNIDFDFSSLPQTPQEVFLQYRRPFPGVVHGVPQEALNLRVNNGTLEEVLLVGGTTTLTISGVTVSRQEAVGPTGDVIGTLAFQGAVQQLEVGFEDFLIDSVQVLQNPEPSVGGGCQNYVGFETVGLFDTFGPGGLGVQGGVIFSEDGVDVARDIYDTGAISLFNQVVIVPPWLGFGDFHVLRLLGCTVRFDLPGLIVGDVTFEYRHSGAGVNLQINGENLFIVDSMDQLPANPAPGVSLTVTPDPLPSDRGQITLSGAIESVRIGAQVFMQIDNFCVQGSGQQRRGDCNQDGVINIADAIALLSGLFTPGVLVPCESTCDTNDDGAFNIADGIYLLAYLFQAAAPEPPAPFPDCGLDPTPDMLGCATLGGCP